MDDALTEFVVNHLVRDNSAVIEEMFRQTGPLATFSSKIRMAYLIGGISKLVFDNLETIRTIRNDFAHSRGDLKFSEQSISDRCNNLFLQELRDKNAAKTKALDEGFSPRKAFVATGLGLTSVFIEFRIAPTMSEDRKEDYAAKHLAHVAESMMEMVRAFAKAAKK